MVTYNIHDFVLFDNSTALECDGPLPAWVEKIVNKKAVAVIRRGESENKIPVGIRGKTKAQKFGTFIRSQNVKCLLKSTDVLQMEFPKNTNTRYWQILAQVREYLGKHGLNWEISGSAAYELVTQIPTVTTNSDIDLIALKQEKLSRVAATSLLRDLNSFGIHADVQIIRGTAGFSLEEYVQNRGRKILIKSNHGPYLSLNPWDEFE
ncbi:MAG: malonate decarboxylase holo-ACP synthase [Ligilactobacillus agilis]|nr:malonate decarboxylase holo-ACP synthase [Ligilactobacillus agilis]